MMLRTLQKGQICPQPLPAHFDNDTLGLPKYSPRVRIPLPRFKFGSSESANKLYQLLSHLIRIIHIRMVISCIHDFTLVSKHSTKLLL
jgi:hypothetical protein